jgi:hypothetical protein
MFKQPVSGSSLLKKFNGLLILTLLISLLMIVLTQWPHLWDKYRVIKDMQNFYWMARFQDPALFPVDYLRADELIQVNLGGQSLLLYPASLGFGLFFYLANFVIDYIWLSKLLVFALIPICVVYLFKLGKFLVDDLTAVSLSFIFVFFILASSQAISPVTGLQRGLSVPLLIIFFYYMVRERYVGAGASIVLSALIYWPSFVLMVVAYGLSIFKFESPLKISIHVSRGKLLPLVVSSLISIALIALVVIIQPELFFPSAASVARDPIFQAGGPTPMFISFPWLGRAGIFDMGTEVFNFVILLVLASLVLMVVGRRSWQRLPAAFWQVLAAGCIMYVASFVVLFVFSSTALYLPSRYTRVTFILCAILFVGLNWGDFLRRAPAWFRRKAPQLIFFVASLALALGLIFLVLPHNQLLIPLLIFLGVIASGLLTVIGATAIYWWIQTHLQAGVIKKYIVPAMMLVGVLGLALFYSRTLGTEMMNPTSSQRDVYEFVATLPQNAVIAGDPELMSGIPLFSKRSVLFRELHPNANPNVTPLILNYYDAQYAESFRPVLDMCQRYQVSYLVLDTTEFEPDYLAKGEFFFDPWNDEIVNKVKGRSDFVLTTVPPVFASGPYQVIACNEKTLLSVTGQK